MIGAVENGDTFSSTDSPRDSVLLESRVIVPRVAHHRESGFTHPVSCFVHGLETRVWHVTRTRDKIIPIYTPRFRRRVTHKPVTTHA